MKQRFLIGACAIVVAAAVGACDEAAAPEDSAAPALGKHDGGLPAPSPIVTAAGVDFWPFTGVDFTGNPQDPISLIFTGQSDPRALRAALLFLDGDRTGFGMPDVFPFNCTWKDAIGGVQTGYGEPAGWVGSAIQLECGEDDPVRFHVRFFDLGDGTLGGAHFELLIPGTTDHQVISWELAEQLATVDFIRSGLLGAAPGQSGPINPAPSFREIPAVIYNGIPVELRAAIGGPLGDVTEPVPIGTDGSATILHLAGSRKGKADIARQELEIEFNQVIPKPFCESGPFDFLHVFGPVRLRQQVVFTPSGNFVSQFHANGHLELTPVNPLTEPPTPIGTTYRANVNEHHKGIVTDNVSLASQFQLQIEIPPRGPFRGALIAHLNVGPGGSSHHSLEIRCEP